MVSAVWQDLSHLRVSVSIVRFVTDAGEYDYLLFRRDISS